MTQDRRELRRQEILDSALAVADREGLEQLTIRRLCDELGLSAPIVYRHFKDKDAIVAGLVQRLLESEPLIRRAEQPAADWLRQLFLQMRGVWLAHPGMMAMMTSADPLKSQALRTADGILEALLELGLDSRAAGAAFHTLMSYLLGSVALARGTSAAGVTADLPDCPHLAQSGRYMDARDERVFAEGLDRQLEMLLPAGSV